MRTVNVIVEPYNKNWKTAFEAIRQELEAAIGDLIVGIEHIGSTSVEGLSAKPCIDIDGYIACKSPCIEELYKLCGLKGEEC